MVATWYISNKSMREATCLSQGLGKDTETSPDLRAGHWEKLHGKRST